MEFVIILLIVVFVALIISFYAYRIAFYSPKRDENVLFRLPKGEQYEKEHANILKWIHEMMALPFEDVSITAYDGTKLYGRYLHLNDSAPVQIMLHGYRSSAYLDFCGGIKFAIKSNHNVLVIDQRSHGRSEGSTITFGIKERHDCLSWIQYLNERFSVNTPIILSGLSMGAATVLMASNLNLPENVVGIVADCPFSSPKAILQKVGQDMHYPPKLMYPFIKLGAHIFGHFHLEEIDALTAVKQAKIPILIFHGDDDRFVPCEMSHALKEACPQKITLEIVSGAGHGLCYLVGPKQYEEALRQFFDRILN